MTRQITFKRDGVIHHGTIMDSWRDYAGPGGDPYYDHESDENATHKMYFIVDCPTLRVKYEVIDGIAHNAYAPNIVIGEDEIVKEGGTA